MTTIDLPRKERTRRKLIIAAVRVALDLNEIKATAVFETVIMHHMVPKGVKHLDRILDNKTFLNGLVQMGLKEMPDIFVWIRDAVAHWVMDGKSWVASRPGGASMMEILEEAISSREGGFNE
jgi:hypothetical protein